MTDERTVIICGESSDLDGCLETTCADCGREIVVAPSGQEIMREQDAIPVCTPCGMAAIESEDDLEIMPPTESQVREIRKQIARDYGWVKRH